MILHTAFAALLLMTTLLSGCGSFEKLQGRSEADSGSSGAKSGNDNKARNDEDTLANDPEEEQLARLYLIDALETDNKTVFSEAPSDADIAEAEKLKEEAAAHLLAADKVAPDMRKDRLDRMVRLIMAIADKDKSNTLSSEEFLDFRLGADEFSQDAEDRIIEWRTKLFAKFAGEDEELASDELRLLLKSLRKYVAKLRDHGGSGIFGSLVRIARSLWHLVIARYDKDQNDHIDATERDLLEADGIKILALGRKFIEERCSKEEQLDAKECKLLREAEEFCEERSGIFEELLCGEIDDLLAELEEEDPAP